MIYAIAAVSVLLNVILLVVLFYSRQLDNWRDGIADESVIRPGFRRYVFRRTDDVSGVSGTGDICEVAEFSDGHAALHWLGKWPLTTPHPEGIKQILEIHGHEGKGLLVPIDPV
jgi:hypothetical protein